MPLVLLTMAPRNSSMVKVKEIQGEQYNRGSLLGTVDSSADQERRTAFSASKHARSSYKPTLLIDSGFFVDDS